MQHKRLKMRLEASWEQIAAAYASGQSIERIANHFECSGKAIRTLLTNHNIPIRRQGGMRKDELQEVRQQNDSAGPH